MPSAAHASFDMAVQAALAGGVFSSPNAQTPLDFFAHPMHPKSGTIFVGHEEKGCPAAHRELPQEDSTGGGHALSMAGNMPLLRVI
jgi:hypothetical protein